MPLDYSRIEDEILLKLLKLDDEKAFNHIYSRHWQVVFSEAHKRQRDIPQTQEIVTDIFAELWLNRKEKEIVDLKKYLAVTTRSKVLAIHRKEQCMLLLRDRIAAHGNFYSVATDEFLVGKEWESAVPLWAVYQPKKRMEIFRMKFYQRLSSVDISINLEIPERMVRQQLQICNNQLKRYLLKG